MEDVRRSEARTFVDIDKNFGFDDCFGFGTGNSPGNGSSGSGFDDCSGFGFGDNDGAGTAAGYGFSSGYGGSGGSVTGHGHGYGYGYGNGVGDSDGTGHGHGNSLGFCDITKFCGKPVFGIDGIMTAIHAVYGNVARGQIIHTDLTTTACYIVKRGSIFTHGETLRGAMKALHNKIMRGKSLQERISDFWKEHKPGVKYPARDFFEWHNILTGSCEAGRLAFARDHGIDLDKDTFTVDEFINITREAYGGSVIEKLSSEHI